MKPFFTEEQDRAISDRYQSGESTVKIARSLNCNREHIRNALGRCGVTLRPACGLRTTRQRHGHLHGNRVLTSDQEKDLVQQYTSGKTMQKLAEHFGVSRLTVDNTLKRYSVTSRPCGVTKFRTKEQTQLIAKWRLETTPLSRIRKLLTGAKSNAQQKERIFEKALFDVFGTVAPTHCDCCGCALDYSIKPRRANDQNRTPSIDRRDNSIGYTVDNVSIVCFRCNRLKHDASLTELKFLVAYLERPRP